MLLAQPGHVVHQRYNQAASAVRSIFWLELHALKQPRQLKAFPGRRFFNKRTECGGERMHLVASRAPSESGIELVSPTNEWDPNLALPVGHGKGQVFPQFSVYGANRLGDIFDIRDRAREK